MCLHMNSEREKEKELKTIPLACLYKVELVQEYFSKIDMKRIAYKNLINRRTVKINVIY